MIKKEWWWMNQLNQNKMKDNKLIAEVISFLMDNEQYGDNWGEHIELLNKLINEKQ